MPRILKKTVFSILLCLGASLSAQNVSQLALSQIQEQANRLAGDGRLIEALPYLEELISRVDGDPKNEVELDFPLFLAGTAEIQNYVKSKNASSLGKALAWYQRLQDEYPDSPKVKEALLKSVDVYRILKRDDDAKALIQRILSEGRIQLSYTEENKLIKDFVELTYYKGKLDEGLPVFIRLLDSSRSDEDKALAAAALFEAYVKKDQLDEAVALLPNFVQETEVGHLPQLNVSLLEGSDKFVSKGRFNEAGIMLNIIKTTDVMIEYHERKIANKKNRIEQIKLLSADDERIDVINEEIAAAEGLLENLRKLPTLRNDLLVRRARNYTIQQRPYEAFWMFYDLMIENPEDKQSEFYYYAAFSNALRLDKNDAIIQIGRDYRENFPEGDNFEDVTSAFALKLSELEYDNEFLEVAESFLSERPLAAAGGTIYAQWANHLLQRGDVPRLIEKSTKWQTTNKESTYEDGIYYWRGITQLILANYGSAIGDFDKLIASYPNSTYYEESKLRRSVALFYSENVLLARDALYGFTAEFPESNSLDQAYFFLGEVESYTGNYDLSLRHFMLSIELTNTPALRESATFRIGEVQENLGRYDDMVATFEGFITEYPESSRITDVIFQLGRGYEYIRNPNGMLTLYRNSIKLYISDPANLGIDSLIEGYVEKYDRNLSVLTETNALLDQLENDLEFRTKFVTDRGFLFEQFYYNKDLEPSLYNRLRNHPSFTEALVSDLSPIADITSVYREQLASYPSQTPAQYFKSLLQSARAAGDRTQEIRLLMGLYRSGDTLAPQKPFNEEDLATASPRVLLYIADNAKDTRIQFAVKAWEATLERFPEDDACIVAYLRLADYNEQQGELAAALKNLQAIEAQFSGSPKLPAVILRQGDILTKMGQSDTARARYQYILKVPEWRGEAHARALLQTGDSYVADKAYDKAHGFYERTFLTYPQFGEWSARAYIADAEVLLKLGSKQDAVSTLQEAVDRLAEAAPVDLFQAIQSKLKELQS